MDQYHQPLKAESKIKFKPSQAANEAAVMLGQLHQAGLRGKAQMFTENLDRDDDTDGTYQE